MFFSCGFAGFLPILQEAFFTQIHESYQVPEIEKTVAYDVLRGLEKYASEDEVCFVCVYVCVWSACSPWGAGVVSPGRVATVGCVDVCVFMEFL